MVSEPLLEVKGLKTHFDTPEGTVRAVDGVDLTVRAGETLCVVGESGCGKSITARSILQLVERPGRIVDGEILYHPQNAHLPADDAVDTTTSSRRRKGSAAWRPSGTVDIASLGAKSDEIRGIRGKEIAMIFQEPMSSLSPVHTIGKQITESLILHEGLTKHEARERAIDELRNVGMPRPEERIDAYTFQLSGGMRQRAMIAMALACRPRLLIADEPTTALDVTTQAQILELIEDLKERLGMAIMFITHDLGVVAEIADRVSVMYLGLVAEEADVDSIFHAPQHPYTRALLRSVPTIGKRSRRRLEAIRGMVPHPLARPAGCPFNTRCDEIIGHQCETTLPDPVLAGNSTVRCLLYSDTAQQKEPAKGGVEL